MKIDILGKTVEIRSSILARKESEVEHQVEAYLAGTGKTFDVGIDVPESFTGEVMQAVTEIKYGKTVTYGAVAEQVGSSPLAVGQACGNNPVPVIVPCHRVVGKNSIGGYLYGEEFKRTLLELENTFYEE